jgi:translocation and assembly module TamB
VVYRSGTDLRLYGNLAAVRGTYALTIGPIVRQFDVTGGSVRFLGTADLNPELDITAAHQIRSGAGAGGQSNLTIVVRVTGTAEYPRVTLTSDTQPPLPESELLNYLVFGQPSFRLSQQQSFAQQVVVQEVLGGILMQGLGQLGLPCQYLHLRGTETMVGSPLARLGSTSLECGVQLLRDVFLTLETGVTSAVNQSNPFNALLGVSLDWQVANYLAARLAREPVRTSAGPLFQSRDVPYQWSADVNGTWEFGKPDTSKIIRPDVPETRLPGVVAPAPPPAPAQPPAPPGEPPAAAPATPAAAPARREGSASPR